MRCKKWKHKKRKGVYIGNYRYVKGEREFILISTEKGRTKDAVVPYNSHEAAKQAGWVKLKK